MVAIPELEDGRVVDLQLSMVQTSMSSCCRPPIVARVGIIGSIKTSVSECAGIAAGIVMASGRLTIKFDELQPRGAQPLSERWHEPLHQLVAEMVVCLALSAQAFRVE